MLLIFFIVLFNVVFAQISKDQLPKGLVSDYFDNLPAPIQDYLLQHLPLPNAPVITPSRPVGGFKTMLEADGGGIRGIISAMQLISLNKAIKEIMLENPTHYNLPSNIKSTNQFQINLPSMFDSFTGVSAGSWNTLVLSTNGAELASAIPFISAYGLQASDPIALFQMWLMVIAIGAKVPVNATNNNTYVTTGLVASNAIDDALSKIFGPNRVMSSCTKSTYIGATDIAASSSFGFYKNQLTGDVGTIIPTAESLVGGRGGNDPQFSERVAETAQDHPGREFLMWQVARCSSAIPSLSLPFEIQTVPPTKPIDGGQWILMDGALTHNNPIALHLSFLLRTGNVEDLNNLAVLSLGTTRCGPNVTTLNEYYYLIQNFLFAYGTGADDSNPHGNLVQQLLNQKSDKLPPSSPTPGRYLRINRIFERQKIQYIQDPDKRAQYARYCEASYAANEPLVLIEIGRTLADEYYPTLKRWAQLYMFGTNV